MNEKIRDIKISVREIINKAYEEGINLIDEKNKEINILDITNDCIKDINDIRNVLELLKQSSLKLKEEINEKNDKHNLITLDDDFTGIKVSKIIIDDVEIQVKNATDAIVKFCEMILTKDRQKFLTVVEKMPKNFSKNKEDLNDPKAINGCDYFIGTKANATTLFRIIKRIAKNFDINPYSIKIQIK